MKQSRKYILFFVILILTFSLKLNTWNDRYAQVETFRGASLQDEVFYPLKAKSVNDAGLLSLQVGEEVFGKSQGVLLGDRMSVMVSLDFVQDIFGCSAKLYHQERIELQHSGDSYAFYIGDPEYVTKGKTSVLSVPPEYHEQQAFLPLEDLCEFFGIDYQYDSENYQGVIASIDTPGTLPAAFDLRGSQRASQVRDQGSSSTCWAQAALTAVESSLLPEEEHSYSVEHMTENNAFQIDSDMGGEYTMAAAYMLSWNGPVEENKVDKHVQELHFFDHEDLEEIKWDVYQHGGVSTSIYAEITTSNLSKSSYYNKKKNAYCYQGDKKPNHDVVIIGWNDNYSKDNFATEVPEDGAFICQNSWGATFGDGGVFYVSYCDTNIGNQGVCYSKVEKTSNYDTIYQSDLCGWVGQVGFGKEKIHGANIYEAKKDQDIVAAGFYALDEDTQYQLYFVKDFKKQASLANRVEVASGTLSRAGYYTIPFERPFSVEEGEEFAIVLVLYTPGLEHPFAIEYQSDDFTKHVDITDGQGYISNNGLDWDSVEETAKGNLCLKAYGKMPEEKN